MKLIRSLYKKFSGYMAYIVSDDKRRSEVMAETIYGSMAVIASVMSVLNIITGNYMLLIATGCFALLAAGDYIMAKKAPKLQRLAAVSFEIGILALFSYFIVTGGTDNFSIVWLLLLPTLGLFFFGITDGTVLSTVILIVMLLFFHVPLLRNICTDYGDTFRMRFPIVYIACYCVSLLLEYIRYITARELKKMTDSYRYLYKHDVLTGVSNRYNIDDHYAEAIQASTGRIGLLMFDIDLFKKVNDTYGHTAGDSVLKEMCQIVAGVISKGATIHRWGGEEFVIIDPNGESSIDLAGRIHDAVDAHMFEAEGVKFPVTVSIGVVTADTGEGRKFDELLEIADSNLYTAKRTGRDRVVSTEL